MKNNKRLTMLEQITMENREQSQATQIKLIETKEVVFNVAMLGCYGLLASIFIHYMFPIAFMPVTGASMLSIVLYTIYKTKPVDGI